MNPVNPPRPQTCPREGASGKASTGFGRWQAGATLAVILALGLPARAAAPTWPWPVPTDPPAITGTFMESRETRYHTGLDIRTEGTIDWPVSSPVDGWVSRVRCSARGYGLALYIETGEGQTVVFAHLDRFFDPASAILRSAQARSGRYEQDLVLGRGEIPVRRGEIVALSGETGTGAPHVHMEVRDAAQRPLNPADFVDVPDQVAPEVLALRLVPVDPTSPLDRILEDPGAAVPARGRWLVEVLAVDRTGFAPFPVAPRELTLYVDGGRRYRLGHDSLDFDESRQMRLDQRRDERGRWYRLYRREGLTLPGREGPGSAIEVVDRAVELFVVAEDASGHRAEFSAVLLPEVDPRPVSVARFEVDERILRVEAPRTSEMPPVLEGPDQHHLLAAAPGGWRLGLALDGLSDGLWKLLDRGEVLIERELRFPAGGVEEFAAGSAPRLRAAVGADLYPGGALELSLVDVAAAAGLEPVGQGLALVSHGFVPARSLVFEPAQEPVDHALLMRFDGRRWIAIEEHDGFGRTDGFGVVACMLDRSAPVIGDLDGPAERPGRPWLVRSLGPRSAHGIALPEWPRIQIAVEDDGAGLPDSGPTVLLDGSPWPVRWDGERDRILIDGFVPPVPGVHRLTVRAQDLAGRSTERSWDVEFVR